MTAIVTEITTLEEFLKLPYIDESPAWEYINGYAIQKTMPGGKHSLLQKRLVGVIDTTGSNYEAFPELRCTVGNRSIVADIARNLENPSPNPYKERGFKLSPFPVSDTLRERREGG